MTRLSWRQLLIAVALGAVVAALQGAPPVPAMARLSALTCALHKDRC